MTTVRSYEAKTRLPELPGDVERGEVVTITRRGKPVARIVGAKGAEEPVAAVVERIKAARSERSAVTTEEILSARDEGRRF